MKAVVVYEEQEIPPIRKALERGEASLHEPNPGGEPQPSAPATSRACGCCHLWQVLPHKLELEFCKIASPRGGKSSSTSSFAFRLRNPVHAMHVQSQWPITGLTGMSSVADLNLLYGEEQERAAAATTEGLLELWHAGIVPRNSDSDNNIDKDLKHAAAAPKSSSNKASGSSHKKEGAKSSNKKSAKDKGAAATAKLKTSTTVAAAAAPAPAAAAATTTTAKSASTTTTPKAAKTTSTPKPGTTTTTAIPMEIDKETMDNKKTGATQDSSTTSTTTITTTTPSGGVATSTEDRPNLTQTATSPNANTPATDPLPSTTTTTITTKDTTTGSAATTTAADAASKTDAATTGSAAATTGATPKTDAPTKDPTPTTTAGSSSAVAGSDTPPKNPATTLPTETTTTTDSSTDKPPEPPPSTTTKETATPLVDNKTTSTSAATDNSKAAATPSADTKTISTSAATDGSMAMSTAPQASTTPTGSNISNVITSSTSATPPSGTPASTDNATPPNQKADGTVNKTLLSPPMSAAASKQQQQQHNNPPGSPTAMAVVADPVKLLQQSKAGLPAPPLTTTTNTAAVTPPPPPPNPFLLSDAQFRAYQTKEEHIVAMRRAVLAKRTLASTASKKSKAGSGGTGSAASNKKRKMMADHQGTTARLTEAWISAPTLPTMTKAQEEAYFLQMKQATQQVEQWMEHFRLARRTYWRGKRSETSLVTRRRGQFVAWGALGSPIGGTPSMSGAPCCSICRHGFGSHNKGRILGQCLDCHFIGCYTLQDAQQRDDSRGQGKQQQSHLLEHMAMSGHHLGVTLEDAARLFCFDCDDFVRHKVFDQEMLRLDLVEKMSWLGWTEQPVARFFDAMRFRQIPDVGILWNGMVAAYPTTIPLHHWEASQRCHKRYFCFSGQAEYLLAPTPGPVLEFAALQKSMEPSRRFKISKPIGIYNLGDTCFQSAVFQCLLNCAPVQEYFLKVGHHHAACPFYPRDKPGKPLTEKKKLAAQVCLACELDKMFLNYYASSIGFRVTAALSSSSSVVTELPQNMTQPQGEAIIASEMLAATWRCPDLSHLAGYGQNDAHEFLHGFLDVLQKHIQKYRKAVATAVAKGARGGVKRPTEQRADTNVGSVDIINSLFEGKLRSVLLCTECGEKRKQSESFLSISLPLSKEVHKVTEVRPGESTDGQGRLAKSKLSVERQLRHFTIPESLSDPVDCPACKKKTSTIKQHVVSRLPKILCLHLKRFDDKKKINDFVSFPLKGLNMGGLLPQFCEVTRFDEKDFKNAHDSNLTAEAELLYDLFATVNHFGTLQSGHYVANVMVGNEWYHCNDAHVSHVSADDVLKSDAYLLMYQRRTIPTK